MSDVLFKLISLDTAIEMPSANKKRRREQVIAHTRSIIDELKSTCDGITTKSSNISSEVSDRGL